MSGQSVRWWARGIACLLCGIAASGPLAAQEPPAVAATLPDSVRPSPLPSTLPLIVDFEITATSGGPVEESVFGFTMEGARSLWWHWEAPTTGWFAIDRPDEPDGASDELPQAVVFAKGAEDTLELKSDYDAWGWYRAAWFRARKGESFVFAMVGQPCHGRWRLQRLGSLPVPPGEEAVVIPSAPGVEQTWKLTRARMGPDEDPQEVVITIDEATKHAFKGMPPPSHYPPGVGDPIRWSWVVPRSGVFEFSRPPDGWVEARLKDDQDYGAQFLMGEGGNRSSGGIRSTRVAVRAGQQLDITLQQQRIDSEAVVEVRELPWPTNTTPEAAVSLHGVGGKISALYLDAFGPPDSPPGTYHPDRFPLWWTFVAPTDGRFVLSGPGVRSFSYVDVRQKFFTLTGRVQVFRGSPDAAPEIRDTRAAVPVRPESLRRPGDIHWTSAAGSWPREWILSPGDTLWIRAAAPAFYMDWKWTGE